MAIPINYSFVSGGNDSEIRSRHHAASHNWEIEIENQWDPSDSRLTPLRTAFNELKNSAPTTDIIKAMCTQVSIPNTNVSTVEGNVRGVHFHQIQTRANTPIQTSMVFYEPYDYRLYRLFEFWKSLTVSRWDGSQNPRAKLKRGVTLTLFSTDRVLEVMKYHLYDTYCASAQISDPQGSGALQQLSVTLQSANYGITVPDQKNPNGDPVYQDIAVDENAYLGTDTKWITATGDTVTS